MHVPTDAWSRGSWNNKLSQFRVLAEMLGVTTTSITPGDLQVLFRSVASAKVFADNVQAFLDAAEVDKRSAADRIEAIERKLGLTEVIPFMSLQGIGNPSDFDGVAIWPTGITNWTELRLEQILLAQTAGARFRRIICLHSSRICNAPADRRHPLIASTTPGQEPTEKQLQQQLIGEVADPDLFHVVDLPDKTDQGKVLNLVQQLEFLQSSGQYDELIGGADIYVPSTPNSLYVPLRVRRALGHDNVWFSQAGARLMRTMPDYWWPGLQDVMTLPNGMIRLWVELLEAGCITR